MNPVRPLNPVRNIYYPKNFGKISNGVNIRYICISKHVRLSNKDLMVKSKFGGLTG